jgi:hypothetical protein
MYRDRHGGRITGTVIEGQVLFLGIDNNVSVGDKQLWWSTW